MRRFLIYSLLVLFLAWIIGFVLFNQKINSYQIDNQTKTDAIIVLTGGRNRIIEAVRLLDDGMAERMLISGVQENISPKDIEKRNAVNLTNKPEIEFEKQSKNTVENAIKTNEWIKQNNINSIRLVTSNYHIPRSLQEFMSQNTKLEIIINPVYSEKVSKKWWKNVGSFCLIASEYNKFLFVYLTNHLSTGK